MELEAVANALKELGHPTRLSVYKALVRVGKSGLPVGELQRRLDIPNSTLSHHISALVSVGLLQQRREGRILYCLPQYEVLNQIVSFLVEECCAEQGR
ncbi:ArsR family transcriptional regulator [Serratia fonticola]|uniref:ArsR/SmtB family transcription factor n=1 Tax=Serratia fonticola TaxID=47917 RepID=UPI00040961A8|nr:metalloregulator ArsR/SmtB family transcription factor [Serratia fonticola]ATM79294.1 ArsR family transcriptional regulator [Serratia fonticola]MBC3217243.1 helix-turn-helix transcriptional regulator [Serratia fonticola]MBC3229063.1 helix-turn-helix transcriptional regulator [Serratia fonticola]MBL5862174.1 helix-turn-helix transcriptional regulator [Serratia fonticola]